jgi:Zn-dependent protease with chaperone function
MVGVDEEARINASMVIKLLPFILFSIIFLFLANRHVFMTVLQGLGKPKAGYSKLEDPVLSDFIEKKTGVIITTFYLVDSDLLFGAMTGIPGKPIVTLSRGLYENFSPEELQYVLLHEAGHYQLSHIIKEAVLQLGILLAAFFLFRFLSYPPPILFSIAIVSAVLLAILSIQVMRSFEWRADAYALKYLDNPNAMITATQKFKAGWPGPADDTLARFLFYRGVPYSQRIQHASDTIKQ